MWFTLCIHILVNFFYSWVGHNMLKLLGHPPPPPLAMSLNTATSKMTVIEIILLPDVSCEKYFKISLLILNLLKI